MTDINLDMSERENTALEKPLIIGGKELHLVSRSGYYKGNKVETFVEFAHRIQDRKPFYWRHKFMAAGFIEHWSVIMILNSIKYGVLWTAEKVDGQQVELLE